MAEVVKSIFRQREIEKLYELKKETKSYGLYSSSYEESFRVVGNYNNVISDKEIGRYDIDIPMLKIGDKFFLHDIQEIVRVKDKMRSSDGYITYYVEDKFVETENTKKSYEEYKSKLEHWSYEKEKFKELEKEYKKYQIKHEEEFEKLEKEFEEYKRKYKYEHRFFNKKLGD